MDDDELPAVAGRHTCIGDSAEPFGTATVEVFADGSDTAAVSASTSDRAWSGLRVSDPTPTTATGCWSTTRSGPPGGIRSDSESSRRQRRVAAVLDHLELDGDQARLTPMSGLLVDGHAQPMTALTPRNEMVYPPMAVEG